MAPVAVAAAVALSCVSAPARGEPIVWRDEEWTRVKGWEYAMTTTLALGSAGISFFAKSPNEPRWSGAILFDAAARDTFRLGNDKARSTAGVVSDALYYTNSFFPLVFDAGIVAWGARASPEAAWQMFAIDAEAFSISGIISAATQRFVARERPFVTPCRVNPGNADCDHSPAVENVSFISGHSAMAFTGAMLTCFHHRKLRLYDNRVADDATCAAFMATATATSFLRMMSDRHYASDVIVGTSLGIAIGYLVPAIHYDVFTPKPILGHTILMPRLGAGETGLSLVGQF